MIPSKAKSATCFSCGEQAHCRRQSCFAAVQGSFAVPFLRKMCSEGFGSALVLCNAVGIAKNADCEKTKIDILKTEYYSETKTNHFEIRNNNNQINDF